MTSHHGFETSWNPETAPPHPSQASLLASPSFSISASPKVMTIGQCFTQTTTITVNSTITNGAVVLTGSSSPSLTLFFEPSVVQVTPGASVNSTMAIKVATDAPPGGYNVTVSGSNNGVSESTQVFVQVTQSTTQGDFYLTPTPSSVLIPQGQARMGTITVSSCNGFNGAVTLGASVGGLTVSFNPTVVDMLPNGTSNSTMTVIVPSGTNFGNYSVLISGTSGSLFRPTSLIVRVVASSDEAPTASFTFTPTNPVAGHTVQFDATASSDPDGSVTVYSWAWGDGQSGSGPTATHSFDLPGQHTVALTVTDSAGAVGGVTHDIQVTPAALMVSIAATPSPPRGAAPLAVNFTATGSGGVAPYSYSWDFGDGNTGSGQTVSHKFASQGDYNVTITLTDASSSKTTSSLLVPVSAPTTGQLTVNVRDSSGNPIGGATVMVTAAPSGQTLPPSQTTGANGSVTFHSLLPGSYTYKVSASGYSDSPPVTTTVSAGQTQMENASLSKIQGAAPTAGDYTIVYVAIVSLVMVLAVFIALRRRHQPNPGRRFNKQGPRKA